MPLIERRRLESDARREHGTIAMSNFFEELNPPPRRLMGPGPVDADPRVLRAMSMPLLGQFDPRFTDYMNEVQSLYREVFCTRNAWTLLVDGTELGPMRVGGDGSYRASGAHAWSLPASATATDRLQLTLRVQHEWLQSAWWPVAPRVSVGLQPDGHTAAVHGFVGWSNQSFS